MVTGGSETVTIAGMGGFNAMHAYLHEMTTKQLRDLWIKTVLFWEKEPEHCFRRIRNMLLLVEQIYCEIGGRRIMEVGLVMRLGFVGVVRLEIYAESKESD
jgi:hypothetical protein